MRKIVIAAAATVGILALSACQQEADVVDADDTATEPAEVAPVEPATDEAVDAAEGAADAAGDAAAEATDAAGDAADAAEDAAADAEAAM